MMSKKKENIAHSTSVGEQLKREARFKKGSSKEVHFIELIAQHTLF